MNRVPLVLLDARLPNGTLTSLRIVDGIVAQIGADPTSDDHVFDLAGALVLPALAEAHAHLDKAFLAETIPNPDGDLMGAIHAMDAHRDAITLADTVSRAERAARLMAANGATVIRTHADLTQWNGFDSVEALLTVRDRLRDLVDIEVVALTGWPTTGAEGADHRAMLRTAISMGVDAVGGCPHLEPEPMVATDNFLAMAADAGVPVDLHTDETLDPARFTLEHLADQVIASGFPFGVTASHCVSLGMQPIDVQRRVAHKLAAAGVSVVALPSTNLFLQGREHQQAMPRALTAVAALRAAGVNVAGGYDNLQDPFNPVGRGDCLETASLMVSAAHLLPDDAYHSVSAAVRTAMRRPAAGPAVGHVADLVAYRATTVRETIAFAPSHRIVFKQGVRISH